MSGDASTAISIVSMIVAAVAGGWTAYLNTRTKRDKLQYDTSYAEMRGDLNLANERAANASREAEECKKDREKLRKDLAEFGEKIEECRRQHLESQKRYLESEKRYSELSAMVAAQAAELKSLRGDL